jgi:hypothetical protein
MVGVEIDARDLEGQLRALAQTDQVLAAEFRVAGQATIAGVVKDLRSGLPSRSGELRGGLTGEVKQMAGLEMDAQITSGAMRAGYGYGAALDRSGYPRWVSGKYRGRRTRGWFSYAGPRVAQRLARRHYQRALDRGVQKLVKR